MMHGPQTPEALPGLLSQTSPGQQSALVLHNPQFGMHCNAAQT
jgi:hypothetical protein